MKTKNKKTSISRPELLRAWLVELCRRGYCEDYIGSASVEFYETMDDLDASEEFNFER